MTLTSSVAQNIILAAAQKAEAIGISVNIAVIDTGTYLKAFLRMDGAVLGSIDLAMKKGLRLCSRSTAKRSGSM